MLGAARGTTCGIILLLFFIWILHDGDLIRFLFFFFFFIRSWIFLLCVRRYVFGIKNKKKKHIDNNC